MRPFLGMIWFCACDPYRPRFAKPTPRDPAGGPQSRRMPTAAGSGSVPARPAAAQSRAVSVESVTAQSATKVRTAFVACAYSHCRRNSSQLAGATVQLLVAWFAG